MTSDLIPLSDLPTELLTLTGRSVGYRRIYTQVVDARVPAEKQRGRWFVRRRDLPAVAAALDLVENGLA